MVADEVLSILHTYGANADGNVIEPAAQKTILSLPLQQKLLDKTSLNHDFIFTAMDQSQ